MNKEFSFALIFPSLIYLLCNYFYIPLKVIPKDAPIELAWVEYPVATQCQLTFSRTKNIHEEIGSLISKVRASKYTKLRRNQLLPVPQKTYCVSPNIIKKELTPLIGFPKLKRIKNEIIIAVIDTGIDLQNPYLSKRIHIPLFLKNINDLDFSKSKSIQDEHGHGSHVAGIILSVFPSAKILPLRYYNKKATGLENLNASIEALRYAVNQNVDVINYSNGGPESSEEELAIIQEAEKKGIIIVTAAGNDRANIDLTKDAYFPASYDVANIISVGNLNRQGLLAKESNYGRKKVDLVAPGEEINSYSIEGKNCLQKLSGTSMATPLVTATVALLKAYYPDLSYQEIKNTLLNNVSFQENLFEISKTGGKLDIARSLASLNKKPKL